jgi:hypothetical protein
VGVVGVVYFVVGVVLVPPLLLLLLGQLLGSSF